MLNDDIRRLHRFTTSAEASYARAQAAWQVLQKASYARLPRTYPKVSETSYDSQNSKRANVHEKNAGIDENESQVTTNNLQNDVDDAIATLVALGIPRTSATRAVNGVLAPGLNVAELVAAALRRT